MTPPSGTAAQAIEPAAKAPIEKARASPSFERSFIGAAPLLETDGSHQDASTPTVQRGTPGVTRRPGGRARRPPGRASQLPLGNTPVVQIEYVMLFGVTARMSGSANVVTPLPPYVVPRSEKSAVFWLIARI